MLDSAGDLRRWVGDLIGNAPDRRDAADEYRAVGSEAAFAYLSVAESIDAQNRVGVLYQVVRRAVIRQAAHAAGFAGMRSLSERRARYRQVREQLRSDSGREPSRAEVFAAAARDDRKDARRPRLSPSEADHYEGGGIVHTVELDAVEGAVRARDIADEAAAALESVRVVRAVVDAIISSYREQTGLLWFAMVLAEARLRSDGPDNVAKVAARAGLPTARAMQYHAVVRSHPRLDAAISSGADGHIIAVALEETPDRLGLVTWSRTLLREVLSAAPGEAGLLTYARSWLVLAADLGRSPSKPDVVRAVEASTGVRISERQMRGYSKALAAVLEEIRVADEAISA
ncbi:MAG: hypothetical protein V4737_01265 [Curtobacterium sp.]